MRRPRKIKLRIFLMLPPSGQKVNNPSQKYSDQALTLLNAGLIGLEHNLAAQRCQHLHSNKYTVQYFGRLYSEFHTNSLLFLLLYILLGGLLCPLGADAKEACIGTGHAQAGESLELLLVLRDHVGLLFLVDVFNGHDRSSELCCHLELLLLVLSPFLGAEAFLGKRMSLERYSFSLWTLACRDSVDLLRRRGSTAMPMVRATLLLMPAAFSSSREKPRPARTLL
uniref:Uncharacterized protein n=1 Tax=Pygocentrus nattereri TaxID=42514 RepID=A0AAR2L509_PYGNA